MLVYIASYDVPNEILLLVEFFFHGGKMCKFTHLTRRGPEFLESLGSDLSRKSECFVEVFNLKIEVIILLKTLFRSLRDLNRFMVFRTAPNYPTGY